MNELVIISGKGGTGKTSITASFAALSKNMVIADCDVDAPDLHLLLSPNIIKTEAFYSGNEAVIQENECTNCGICLEPCRFGGIIEIPPTPNGATFAVNPIACEGCGVCVWLCPMDAIEFPERQCGEWMTSHTAYGDMVHALLGIGAENSGKLVSRVRQEARLLAQAQSKNILIDGPPGIGCATIAAITGAHNVLIVTEPTVAGEHDLVRTIALTKHFGIPIALCVNKWDINVEMTQRIENKAKEEGVQVIGRIRYDARVTQAQIEQKTLVDYDTAVANDIRAIWDNLKFN